MSQDIGAAAGSGHSINASRRGFLGSTGLAAAGAILGGALPLSGNGAGIPAAQAQAGGAAAPAQPKGRNI
jgi:sulfite oxidase